MRTVAFALTLLLLAGCSRGPSPEQKEADRILAQAREAYARNAFHESRRLFRASLVMDERLGRIPQVAEAFERLAAIEAAAGRTDSALALYRAASERHQSLADRDAVRLMTLQMAGLYRRTGDERAAHRMLTEALRLALLFKEEEGVAEIRWALVGVCRALEMEDEETTHLDALLQAAVKAADIAEQARVYREAGLSALGRMDHQHAAENMLKALTFSVQSHDSLLTIDVLYGLARAYTAAGNVTGAFEAYSDALRRTDRTRGAEPLRHEMLTRVGTVYLRSGSPAEAARFYRPALSGAMAVGNKVAEGYLFIQLGHCEAQTPGGSENAVRNYRSAFELFSAASYHRGTSYALASLGAVAERQNQLLDALEYYRKAVSEDERVLNRRDPDDVYIECENNFRESRGPAAEDPLIELLLQLGRSDEAFWFTEQKQERALAEDLGALQIRTGDFSLDSLLRVWHHTRSLVVGAERQLVTLFSAGPGWQSLLVDVRGDAEINRRQMEETAAAIVQRRPSLAPAVRPSGLAVAEVQRAIPDGSSLVVYAPASRALYSFILSARGNALQVHSVGRRQLLEQASEFWNLLQRRLELEDSTAELQRGADRRLQELSMELHRPFMRPVESSATGVADLLVVLPREFSRLPLHALRRGGATATRRFVAERSVVRYLPSASSLMLEAAAPAGQHQVAALGHPGTTGWDVEYELRDIRAFFKDAALFFGRQATFEAVKRAAGDVLHITAELRYGNRSAGNSSLFLSDGKSPAGIQTISWGLLPELPPRGALLISDLGPHVPPKNPLLSQLLLMGGSRVVVLHAFTPTRKSRKIFGELWYTSLLSGATPENAFRQAQLEMIRTSQPIHHWAAFCLWGK